jgi:hypothetical protein
VRKRVGWERVSLVTSSLGLVLETSWSGDTPDNDALVAALTVTDLWVPNRSSIRGDLGIFADQFAEQVVASETRPGDAVMIAGRGRRVVASAGVR